MRPARNSCVKATESRDSITGVPVEQSEVPIHMPGTPSGAFVEYVERFVATLLR